MRCQAIDDEQEIEGAFQDLKARMEKAIADLKARHGTETAIIFPCQYMNDVILRLLKHFDDEHYRPSIVVVGGVLGFRIDWPPSPDWGEPLAPIFRPGKIVE